MSAVLRTLALAVVATVVMASLILVPAQPARAATSIIVDPNLPNLPAGQSIVQGFSIPSSCGYGKDVALKGWVLSGDHIVSVRMVITDPHLGAEYDVTLTPSAFLGAGAAPLAGLEPNSVLLADASLGTDPLDAGATGSVLPLLATTPYGIYAVDLASFSSRTNFADLAAGPKTIQIYMTDADGTELLYTQKFSMTGVSRFATFWRDRDDHWIYPLATRARVGSSGFGSSRGGRAHAAIDLMKAVGSKVYAMDSGVVQYVYRGTYFSGTGAVQVLHADGSVVLYGEVKPTAAMKKGAKVKQGQVIATIQSSGGGRSMLHLEVYAGTGIGVLTKRGNMTYDYVKKRAYSRRRDLLDPTKVTTLPLR